MASNKTVDCRFGTKPKRRSLQQVRSMLSQAAEGTEVPTSCAWRKWKRAHSKPSTAATDNAETPTGDSAPDIVRFSTTTTTTLDHETGGDPQPYKGQKQSGVDGPSKQGRCSSDKTVTTPIRHKLLRMSCTSTIQTPTQREKEHTHTHVQETPATPATHSTGRYH